MTKIRVIEIIKWIKQNILDTKIILGGPDITYNKEAYLATKADYLVIGEGEQTMKELVMFLSEKKQSDPSNIHGIAYLNEESELVVTPPRDKIRSLEGLVLPNRKGINISKYLDTWKKHHGKSALNVSTQRGCPYTCKWCSTAVYGQSYRRRPVKEVVDELIYLKETYNPDTIWFVDDVFTVSHKWIEAFRNEVISRNAIIPFECITRADRLNEEVLKVLKEAGIFRVWIGAESGSQKVIDAMDRRVSTTKVQEMILEANKLRIETGTFIMLGYPGETEADIKETIQHLKKANPTHFTITLAYPIKGTKLFEEVDADLTTKLDWHNSTDRERDFVRTYPRRYYKYALIWVISEMEYHKIQIMKSYLSFGSFKTFAKIIYSRFNMLTIRLTNSVL